MSRFCTRKTAECGNVTCVYFSGIGVFSTCEFPNLRYLFAGIGFFFDGNSVIVIGICDIIRFGRQKLYLVTVDNIPAEQTDMRNFSDRFVMLDFEDDTAEIFCTAAF